MISFLIYGVFLSETSDETNQFTGCCLSNRFLANGMPASSRLVHVLVLDLPAATGVRLGRGAPSHLHGAHRRCPNRQARDKGNPGAPHVQFEARVPGKASKPLCILASVTHWRKDAFRNEQNRAVGITRVRTYFCKGCKRNVRSTTADLRGKPQKHK